MVVGAPALEDRCDCVDDSKGVSVTEDFRGSVHSVITHRVVSELGIAIESLENFAPKLDW